MNDVKWKSSAGECRYWNQVFGGKPVTLFSVLKVDIQLS